MNTNLLDEDWPASIPKPVLPKGYEWVCLRQAFGLRQPDGGHPWWVRVCWTMRNGKQRMLKMGDSVFSTPQQAITFAVAEAESHRRYRDNVERTRV